MVSVYFNWEDVRSATFGVIVEKACFKRLGYAPAYFTREGAYGCHWDFCDYEDNAERLAQFKKVIDDLLG